MKISQFIVEHCWDSMIYIVVPDDIVIHISPVLLDKLQRHRMYVYRPNPRTIRLSDINTTIKFIRYGVSSDYYGYLQPNYIFFHVNGSSSEKFDIYEHLVADSSKTTMKFFNW